MKWRSIVFLQAVVFLGMVVSGCSLLRTPEPAQIRVLTYNIHHGEDMNGKSNLDAVAAVIRTARADLVALQEVDVKTSRSNGFDLIAELEKRTGMHGAFGKAMDFAGGGYGNGVLSRFPILSSKTHALPNTAGEPRAALETRVQLPSGRQVLFISTHLDNQRPQNRVNQARRLGELFGGQFDTPMVLAGDFNARPGSDPIRLLTRDWQDATAAEPEPANPSDNPRSRIDYIFFRPAGRFRVVEARVIDERIASDHRPVLAVLEMP